MARRPGTVMSPRAGMSKRELQNRLPLFLSTRYTFYSVLNLTIRIAILVVIAAILVLVAFLIAQYSRIASRAELRGLWLSLAAVTAILVIRILVLVRRQSQGSGWLGYLKKVFKFFYE
jgi:hypothetical protein